MEEEKKARQKKLREAMNSIDIGIKPTSEGLQESSHSSPVSKKLLKYQTINHLNYIPDDTLLDKNNYYKWASDKWKKINNKLKIDDRVKDDLRNNDNYVYNPKDLSHFAPDQIRIGDEYLSSNEFLKRNNKAYYDRKAKETPDNIFNFIKNSNPFNKTSNSDNSQNKKTNYDDGFDDWVNEISEDVEADKAKAMRGSYTNKFKTRNDMAQPTYKFIKKP